MLESGGAAQPFASLFCAFRAAMTCTSLFLNFELMVSTDHKRKKRCETANGSKTSNSKKLSKFKWQGFKIEKRLQELKFII